MRRDKRPLLLAACWSSIVFGCRAQPPDGIFTCVADDDCPPYQKCAGGLCRVDVLSSAGQRDDAAMMPTSSATETLPGVNTIDSGPATAPRMSDGTSAAGEASPPAMPAAAGGAGVPAERPAAGSGGIVAAAGAGGAGGAGGSACTCTELSRCCDGCRPINESDVCASDDRACTTDVCRAGRCEHELQPNSCLLDSNCYADRAVHPTQPCKRCDATRPSQWADQSQGIACDDGVFCNGVDMCNAFGACVHTGDPCPNQDACTRCDESNKRCALIASATWYDGTTNLLWRTDTGTANVAWQRAVDTCASLKFCGKDDWRLPSVAELRTTVRGCPDTETRGSCGVTQDCLAESCDENCSGCPIRGGPGNGYYWPAAFTGNGGVSWTSSAVSDDPTRAWIAYPLGGWFSTEDKTIVRGPSRCVRTGNL